MCSVIACYPIFVKIPALYTWTLQLGMHDEIFQFEIFKNVMKNLKYFKTPSLRYFMKFLIFIIKWLKTFKNVIKVYGVSRKYIILFVHNNRYLPSTGLPTLLQWTIQPEPWNFLNMSEIFHAVTHCPEHPDVRSPSIQKNVIPNNSGINQSITWLGWHSTDGVQPATHISREVPVEWASSNSRSGSVNDIAGQSELFSNKEEKDTLKQ